MGELYIRVGELYIHVGELYIRVGELSRHMGELSHHVGELSHHVGELYIHVGELSGMARFHKTLHFTAQGRITGGLYDKRLYYSAYILLSYLQKGVTSYAAAQTLSEGARRGSNKGDAKASVKKCHDRLAREKGFGQRQ
jgi:hypothetical protein